MRQAWRPSTQPRGICPTTPIGAARSMRRSVRPARWKRLKAGGRRRIWRRAVSRRQASVRCCSPDTGEPLAEIASVLPYYDVDRSQVQIIGPSLWASPASGSGQLSGAWYAAPDPAARASFEQAFTAKYGGARRRRWTISPSMPRRSRVCWVAAEDFSVASLTQPAGFIGVRWLARTVARWPGAPSPRGVRHRAWRPADGGTSPAVGERRRRVAGSDLVVAATSLRHTRSGLGETGRGILPRDGAFEWWMPRADGMHAKQRRRPSTSTLMTPIAEFPTHAIKSLRSFAALRGECELCDDLARIAQHQQRRCRNSHLM